jgi:probable phosphoglycerate mutase
MIQREVGKWDCLAHCPFVLSSGMGQHLLYLVRHGQYFTDEQHKRAGSLTALGIRQAHRTGKRLAELEFRNIYHSDMPRAVETAGIISSHFPGVPLHSSRLLREVTPAMPRELRKRYGQRPSELELVQVQTEALIKKLFVPWRRKGQKRELVVAHGNLIRYLVRFALADNLERWVQLGTSNCGVTVLSIGTAADQSYLLRFNDIGHLPTKMQSEM